MMISPQVVLSSVKVALRELRRHLALAHVFVVVDVHSIFCFVSLLQLAALLLAQDVRQDVQRRLRPRLSSFASRQRILLWDLVLAVGGAVFLAVCLRVGVCHAARVLCHHTSRFLFLKLAPRTIERCRALGCHREIQRSSCVRQ